MDIQYMLDEYSCAAYVVDYVNESNRGMSNLHRELIRLSEANSEMTHECLLKKLGSKVLNTVELSAQEAAWFLLRQPMSLASRECVYIPTCLPNERQKSHKKKRQLEELPLDSTDIWSKSLVQRYEERPHLLDPICLADFAAYYTSRYDYTTADHQDDEENNAIEVDRTHNRYKRREFPRIIRYRNYDLDDSDNHKREMVTLYVPFRNEMVDILDRQRYLKTYGDNLESIAAKRAEYENVEFSRITEEYRALEGVDSAEEANPRPVRQDFVAGLLGEGVVENFDDFEVGGGIRAIAAVGRRENILSNEEYCARMRTTNRRQRELVHEVIHRIQNEDAEPLQIFLTGPAGSGKTYLLKLIMETYNRYSNSGNEIDNSFVACASTGKAAVNLGGTKIHSAFHMT